MDNEVVAILTEIRNEARQTNARLEQTNIQLDQTNARLDQTNARLDETNTRLAAVEQHVASIADEAKGTNRRLDKFEVRVDTLENRMATGFREVNQRLDDHARRFEEVERQRLQLEMKVMSEIVSMSTDLRELKDVVFRRIDDHDLVIKHEARISAIEARMPSEPRQ